MRVEQSVAYVSAPNCSILALRSGVPIDGNLASLTKCRLSRAAQWSPLTTAHGMPRRIDQDRARIAATGGVCTFRRPWRSPVLGLATRKLRTKLSTIGFGTPLATYSRATPARRTTGAEMIESRLVLAMADDGTAVPTWFDEQPITLSLETELSLVNRLQMFQRVWACPWR